MMLGLKNKSENPLGFSFFIKRKEVALEEGY
nr:MAG TPA: hypothetical protein [Caudoviricetes sp.]DAT82999.1 MAG TPA: hypothetical protein [Caudoviricetes sp.]